ncbi:toxin-antitoxin system, toxin component, PIN family [delta proteobacterium NaphS2]|nr:toxin-antitoxin system, toxin component, PIN family [delta proteobacterium NaphS2]
MLFIVADNICQEIEAGGDSGFGVAEFQRAGFMEKRPEFSNIAPFLQNTLDPGEASVIQLALDEGIRTVCIDEAMGRRVARLSGLNLTGSIGVLIRAKRNGLDFSMRNAINRMQSQGIYLSQGVIDFAFNQVNEEPV